MWGVKPVMDPVDHTMDKKTPQRKHVQPAMMPNIQSTSPLKKDFRISITIWPVLSPRNNFKKNSQPSDLTTPHDHYWHSLKGKPWEAKNVCLAMKPFTQMTHIEMHIIPYPLKTESLWNASVATVHPKRWDFLLKK